MNRLLLQTAALARALLVRWARPPVRGAVLLVGAAALLISCGTLTRTVVAPPSIPGSTFIGTAACADCHDELVRDFRTASHARLLAPGSHALEVGCESCHGPGSQHSDSGGEPGTILNPERDPTTCYQCHLDVRASFNLPYHHPVPEGKLTCTECHDPHRGSLLTGQGTSMLAQNDTCTECHDTQRGPHVFEHEAMREGCTSCHHPHGSVNDKLLTQRNSTLCLKCHFQQQSGGLILIGGQDHTSLLSRGSCWSAGCHEAVHGSQVNSSLRY